MATILITGGSGLIGSALTDALLAEGHAVRYMSRTQRKGGLVRTYTWNVETGTMDHAALEDVDHIVHLAGEPLLGKRWNAAVLRSCQRSRTESARLLLRAATEIGAVPRSFISASGINYYGAITSAHVHTEGDAAAPDTIGQLTLAWERAVDEWAPITRVVKLRTPVVLAREGGGLPRLAAPARFGFATVFGSGQQWMPWIHRDDLVRAYMHAITEERMHGAYNVCAAEQPNNATFTRMITQALHRPLWLPAAPAFALRLAIGPAAVLLLEGSRASAAKLLDTGFRLEHDRLDPALADLLQ